MTATPPRPATQTMQRTPQITLPGQSHTAEGPHDMSGMYLMHHAFRRDLTRFLAAVRATPAGDTATWRALAARWRRFTEVLHHHHVAEDELIWPVMLASAEAEGREDDRRTLLDMEAEHDSVDPALERCAAAFADMVAHPCEDHRNALDVRVTTLRELLLAHLRHEETGALPLAQRTMTAEEWAASEKGSEKSYPARLMPFLLAWVEDSLPPEGRHKLVGTAGPVLGLLLRLVVPPYRRGERRTFRYADSAR